MRTTATIFLCFFCPYLGNVQHEGTLGITVLHGNGYGIIKRAFVKHFGTVLLGSVGRRQVDGNHLQESITGRQPLTHNSFEQGLAFLVLLLANELDSNNTQQLFDLFQ